MTLELILPPVKHSEPKATSQSILARIELDSDHLLDTGSFGSGTLGPVNVLE